MIADMRRKSDADRRAVGATIAKLRKQLDPPRNTINAVAQDFKTEFRVEPGKRGVSKDTWRYVESGKGPYGEPHRANPETVARMAAFVGWDPDEALEQYFDPDDEARVPPDAYRVYRARHHDTGITTSAIREGGLSRDLQDAIEAAVDKILRERGYTNDGQAG